MSDQNSKQGMDAQTVFPPDPKALGMYPWGIPEEMHLRSSGYVLRLRKSDPPRITSTRPKPS